MSADVNDQWTRDKDMNKKKIVIAVIATVILIIGAITAWLFVSGNVTVTFGAKSVASSVCDDGIVERYNTAMHAREDTGDIDKEGLKNIAIDIKKNESYSKDATCQTILYWLSTYGILDDNNDQAKISIVALRKLHEQGVYANSNLRSPQALFMMQDRIDNISNNEGLGG